MKKLFIILALVAFAPSQEKKFKFEFTNSELNLLWGAIDNSNAPHAQIKELQAIIQAQLKSQLDTSKTKR